MCCVLTTVRIALIPNAFRLTCLLFFPILTLTTIRYLSRVCARLSPLYSEERAQLRLSLDAKSLEDALEGMEAAEGDMDVVA